MYARRYTILQSATLREVTNGLYPCAVFLSQALCDVSRIGALGLSSVLARFAYGHIHTALFNCQGTFVGAVFKYAEYIMGVVFKLQITTFIPSSSSRRERQKDTPIQ